MHTSAKFKGLEQKMVGWRTACSVIALFILLGTFVTTKQTIDNAPSIFLVNNILLVLYDVIFFVNIIVDKK